MTVHSGEDSTQGATIMAIFITSGLMHVALVAVILFHALG